VHFGGIPRELPSSMTIKRTQLSTLILPCHGRDLSFTGALLLLLPLSFIFAFGMHLYLT
jgi:hypothetical protein